MIPYKVLQQLPKAELHCHLDGCVRPATIIDLAKEQGVDLPTFDEAELRKLICVPLDCPSLEEYLKGFEITSRVLQKHYAIVRVMYELCEDAVADGVTYLEVRFSPVLHLEHGLALSGVMEAVCEAQSMAEQRLPIVVRIIVCGMRQMPSSVSSQLAEIAWRYQSRGVVGFDLAGPEKGFSSRQHREAYELVRLKHLNCTLHAGEAAGPEYIKDALRFCGANRIGHGCALARDKDLMQYVIDRRVAVETCVTSNVQTKAVPSLKEHPVRQFFDAGVLVVPSCDNRTVSDVTLTSEYDLLQREFNFTVEEIVRMLDNSFSASFLAHPQRRRIRAEAFRKTMIILQSAGIDVSAIKARSWTYDDIGVAAEDIYEPRVSTPFWGQHINPPMTLAVLKALPKADLHCRFDGSVSPQWLWEQMGDNPPTWLKENDIGLEADDFAAFAAAMQQREHSVESLETGKKICRKLVQSEPSIRSALANIFQQAESDGVVYLELVVRPVTHCKRGLTPQRVINILSDEAKKLYQAAKAANRRGVRMSLILYSSLRVDDPIRVKEAAELCVTNRDKVAGFEITGDVELDATAMKFFQSTFYYLKNNNINVVMFAGNDSVATITTALHQGGACRISGGFKIHEDPAVLSYLATHSVPIQLAPSDKMRQSTSDIQVSLGGSLFRFLLDNDLIVTICSFRHGLQPLTRSEQLLLVYKACCEIPGTECDVSYIFKLIGNSFRSNFLPFALREQYYKEFVAEASALLTSKGYAYFRANKFYFPKDQQ